MSLWYVKSLEEDLATKTLVGKEKQACQTLSDIVKSCSIIPNTVSFGTEKRLSTTILHANYLDTYREQGIVFETNQKPRFILPADLIVFTETENPEVHYYKMKDELHLHYNHKLIDGFQEFIFSDIDSLVTCFPTVDAVWDGINQFRVSKGFSALTEDKKRLALYNEAVFLEPVSMSPLALFGKAEIVARAAEQFCLPRFESARQFYEQKNSF